MSLFSRFVTTMHAGVERTVSNMENHEAVVNAALKDSREALMRAKVRFAKLEKEGCKQRDRLTELTSEIELWSERARNSAETDRPKALACLQRKKQREQELQRVREQITEHELIVKKVRGNIEESTNRVEALQTQRNHMRSREAAAQAGAIVNTLDERMGADVESAIERWEIKVGQSEIMNDTYAADLPLTDLLADPLADDFNAAEENQMLEAELDELLNQEGSNNE